MKLLKWFFGLLFGVILLAVIAVVVATLVVDEKAVKEKISTQFESTTGQSLRLDGPLNWSVFPWVGIKLADVQIGSAPGFGDEPLAAVQKLDVKVGIMPLLEKKVAVDTIVLKGVRLNLRKNKDGRTNWEGLAGAGEGKEKEAAAEAKAGGEEQSQFGDFEIQLKGIELEDVSLHFADEQEGVNVKLDDLAVKVGELVAEKPVPLRVSFKLENTKPVMKLDFALSTDMTFSKDYQRLDLAALALDLNAAGEGLPAQGVKLALAANVGLDNKQGVLVLSDLSVSGLNVDITGDLRVSELHAKPKIEAKLALQNTNLKELLEIAGVSIATADPEALTRVSGKIHVQQQGEALTAKPISIKLDDSSLDGELKLLSFDGPVVRASFKLDAIDLDRYLPPKSEEEAAGKEQEQATTAAEKPDFTALRKLDLDAKFSVGSLKINGLKMQNIILNVKSRKGVLRMDPVSAALYEGKFQGSIKLDVRQDTPRFSAKKTLSGIQIEPLLNDLTGKAQLSGVGDIKVDISSMGLDDATIKRNLNGSFSIQFRDGAYIGFNLAQAIRKATGQATSDAPQKTDFAELKGSGVIKNGVVKNDDLYLASPALRVTGKGKVDLVENQVNYLLTTRVVGSLEGQGGSDKLKGVAIPVRIKGDLNNPSPSVDLEAALKANAEHKLEEKKQELMDKAGEKLKDKLGTGALKGLFGK